MIQGERFAGMPRPQRGFGLWPGVHVVPHFDEIPSLVVSGIRRAIGTKLTLIGVNGNTALVKLDDGPDRPSARMRDGWARKQSATPRPATASNDPGTDAEGTHSDEQELERLTHPAARHTRL